MSPDTTNNGSYARTVVTNTLDTATNQRLAQTSETTQTTKTITTSTLPSGNTVQNNTYTTTDASGKKVSTISVASGVTPKIATTTTPTVGIKKYGEACNDASECSSGSCNRGNDSRSKKICTLAMSDRPAEFAKGVALIGAGVLAGLAAPAIIGAGAAITTLAGGSLAALPTAAAAYGGATLATLPLGVQTALSVGGSALTLGGTAWATADCVKSHNPNSPSCSGLVGGYFADTAGFNQALGESANTLVTKPLNNLLDKTVFTGLTGYNPNPQIGDPVWGGGFGTYGGQTLVSRSGMPANLSPQEQSLWLAKADIVENWNYYQAYGAPSRWTNTGYAPNAATELYKPSNINQALDNVPDPLGIIKNLEQQANSGASPAEILASSKQLINNNNILIIDTPPKPGEWWVNTPSGEGIGWSEGLSQPLSNTTTFGVSHSQNNAVAISAEGTKFTFKVNSTFPSPYAPYEGDAILLNRQALDALGAPKELQTVIHEAGHTVESSYMPQVTSNFWGRNANGDLAIQQETGSAATEYISTLYGIKAAQSLAPTSINMAIDTMTNQLLLNTTIVNPYPTYLVP